MAPVYSWTLLAALSLFGFIASTAVAVRMRYESRAETALFACIFWNFLVLVPIHALGLAGRLTWISVAAASTATSVTTLALSFLRTDAEAHQEEVLAALAAFLEMPREALLRAFQARSLVYLALLFTCGLWLWTTYLCILLPSDGWDGLRVHETMVGFTLQNRSYAPVLLPDGVLQGVNGFPRNCEMTNLWFVVFSDHTLIEFVNNVMAIPLVLAVYATAIRYGGERVAASGWACGVFTMPALALELRTTSIDLHVAAFLLAALYFATRPAMRVRDAWAAAMALALLIGTKLAALAWVPALAVIAFGLLVWQHARARPSATAATIGLGAIGIAAWGALTYGRNWVLHKNPIYPFAYGWGSVRWAGPVALAPSEPLRPLKELWKSLVALPTPPSGHEMGDVTQLGYGFAFPFFVVPVAFVGVGVLVFAAVRGWLGVAGPLARRNTGNLLLVVLFLAYTVSVSPGLEDAKSHVQIAAGAAYVVHWLSGYFASFRMADAAAALTTFAHGVSLYWTYPGYEADWTTARLVAQLPAAERATAALAEWTAPSANAAARDRELGTGTLALFLDDMTFPSLLWNERFTNRVQYVARVPSSVETVRWLETSGAKWVVVKATGDLGVTLAERRENWESLGNFGRGDVAYRKK
jgi:hypothetical protein